MRKLFTKIICLFSALIVALGITVLSACAKTYNAKSLGGDFSAGEVVSNGGFAVQKGNYIYFINGTETNSADNTFGKVEKGAIMRISMENYNARNYSSAETVVPLIAYSSNSNGGIFVYGDYVYYSTPSTEKSSEGEVQNNYIAFKSTKLDGTGTMKGYYAQYNNLSTEYRYVLGSDGVVYLVYVAANEDLYGTSHTNIHSVNTQTGVDTLLAYNVGAVMFDKNDLSNPRIYYTMSVTDFAIDKTYSGYNQVYTVTADATQPADYSEYFATVDDYDAKKDPLYVNCGTLVLDGVGRAGDPEITVTPFNGEGAAEVSRSAITYTLSSYQNHTLFYTRPVGGSSFLYAETDEQLLSATRKAVDVKTESLTNKGSDAGNFNYIFGNGGNIEWVVITSSTGIEKAKIADGKITADTDNVNRFWISKDSSATVLFTAEHDGANYLYYSLSGGDGYQVYRICTDGGYNDYNDKLHMDSAYESVQILDVDAVSSWYKPELLGNQLIFASETDNMTAYNYVMACDLRASDGKMMTNAQIEELNDKYEKVSQLIDEADEEVYPNVKDAYRYVFYCRDASYINSLRQAYVDVLDYDIDHFWSDDAMEEISKFINCEDEWAEFADTVKVNGKDVHANDVNYYYSVLGKMTSADAEAYADGLKTAYLESWPTVEKESWWDKLSGGEKAGVVIGIIMGCLIVIAAIAAVIAVIYKKRKTPSEGKIRRVRVDTTDDKEIDVYSEETAAPEEAHADGDNAAPEDAPEDADNAQPADENAENAQPPEGGEGGADEGE